MFCGRNDQPVENLPFVIKILARFELIASKEGLLRRELAKMLNNILFTIIYYP